MKSARNLSKQIAYMIGQLLGPAEIARELRVSTAEAIQDLFIAIGEGLIRESDLFFILAQKYKEETTSLNGMSNAPPQKLLLRLRIDYFDCRIQGSKDYDLDELVLYTSYLKRRVFAGDIYLLLTELERVLHQNTKCVLIQKYGEKESGWWKRGVPETVRINCAQAREFDDESVDHPYHFTTFIHLKKIMDKNWELFSRRLPQSVIGDKAFFLKGIDRLNGIRNQIMHPVREDPPTENDFEFVREMHKKLDASLWRK